MIKILLFKNQKINYKKNKEKLILKILGQQKLIKSQIYYIINKLNKILI